MSFSVQLSQDMVAVEAGSNTPFSVTVTTKGTEKDQFELEIEGIDAEWKAVPVPVFTTDPGEAHVERVFFRPPRSSESLAGNYPFVVRVRSLVTGEQRTCQGVLQIKPYHHVTVEIGPKKGFFSPVRKLNTFDLTVVNLGNAEHTLQLFGSDPEDMATYEFEQGQITVGPGQQKELTVVVSPTSTRFFSSARLVGFTVTARSIEVPSVAATTQAQLEVRSLLSPASLALAVVLALILGLWIAMLPKKPGLVLKLDKTLVTQGEDVNVSWEAHDANHVVITYQGAPVYDGAEVTGSCKITVDKDEPVAGDKNKTETIEGVASKDGLQGSRESRLITVVPAKIVGKPEIKEFKADKYRVKLGESFVLRYSFGSSVKRAVLVPTNVAIEPELEQIEVKPDSLGPQTYSIVAYNENNESVKSKSITVVVYEESDAVILDFHAEPKEVPQGTNVTTLKWQTNNATALLELVTPDGKTQQIQPGETSLQVQIAGKSLFVLNAYDEKKRKRTASVTVDFEKPTAPPAAPDTTSPTPSNPTEVGRPGTPGGAR